MVEGNPNGGNSGGGPNVRAALVTLTFGTAISVSTSLVLEQPLGLKIFILLVTWALPVAIAKPGRLRPWDWIKSIGTHVRIRRPKTLLWLAAPAPGIAVALLIFYVPRLSFGGPCGFATELRVVTAPENVTALRAAADQYASDRSGDGCQNVNVTVNANSSVTGIELGFTSGWLQPGANPGRPGSTLQQTLAIGPPPDIWIPDSMVTAKQVRAYVESHSGSSGPLKSKARLRIDGKVGTSPMVVGVFNDRSGPPQATLSELLTRLGTDAGLRALVRPSPYTSEAALLTTPALYQALTAGAKPWAQSDAEAEKLLNTHGFLPGESTPLQTSDASTLLCRIQGAAAKDRGDQPAPDFAVVVPENVIAAYEHGDDMDDACQGGGRPRAPWQLSVYYPSDLPVLDYPFVQVRWPGEYTARRQAAIDDFRDWLGDDALTRFGFRTGAGNIAPPHGVNPLLQELREGGDGGSPPETVALRSPHGRAKCVALDCYVQGPSAGSLSMLVDASGSMIQLAGRSGATSFQRAQGVAIDIVARARQGDQVRVGMFSTKQAPQLGQATQISGVGNGSRDSLDTRIRQMKLAGSDLPLTEAISQAAEPLSRGSQSLVVLTDGQVLRSNKGVADAAPDLARRLRDENPQLRVLIVLTSHRRCDEDPVKPLAAALGKGSCVDDTTMSTEDVASGVMSAILWGDQ